MGLLWVNYYGPHTALQRNRPHGHSAKYSLGFVLGSRPMYCRKRHFLLFFKSIFRHSRKIRVLPPPPCWPIQLVFLKVTLGPSAAAMLSQIRFCNFADQIHGTILLYLFSCHSFIKSISDTGNPIPQNWAQSVLWLRVGFLNVTIVQLTPSIAPRYGLRRINGPWSHTPTWSLGSQVHS